MEDSGRVQLFIATLADFSCETMLGVVTEAERNRANEFRFMEGKEGYVIRRGVVRLLLGALVDRDPSGLVFETVCDSCGGSHGKPRLVGSHLEFSWSSSFPHFAMAVSWDSAVGVDIERLDRGGRVNDVRELAHAGAWRG